MAVATANNCIQALLCWEHLHWGDTCMVQAYPKLPGWLHKVSHKENYAVGLADGPKSLCMLRWFPSVMSAQCQVGLWPCGLSTGMACLGGCCLEKMNQFCFVLFVFVVCVFQGTEPKKTHDVPLELTEVQSSFFHVLQYLSFSIAISWKNTRIPLTLPCHTRDQSMNCCDGETRERESRWVWLLPVWSLGLHQKCYIVFVFRKLNPGNFLLFAFK